MITNKFDLVTVKKNKEELNRLFRMVNDLLHGIGPEKVNKEDYEALISSFEEMVRIGSMYNDVIEKLVKDNSMVTSDPQKHISANLSKACDLTESVYNKYKDLSTFAQ